MFPENFLEKLGINWGFILRKSHLFKLIMFLLKDDQDDEDDQERYNLHVNLARVASFYK